mgnify:CR=1 FL=1
MEYASCLQQRKPIDVTGGQTLQYFIANFLGKRRTVAEIPCHGIEAVRAVAAAAGNEQARAHALPVGNITIFNGCVIHGVLLRGHCKVYVMSLCERYRYSYTENVSGSSMCRMIDFQNENGEWVMTDSWQPRDGAGYTASIKQTVPKEISDEAVDTQIHIKELMAENTNKIKKYFEKLNDSGSVHNAALLVHSAE